MISDRIKFCLNSIWILLKLSILLKYAVGASFKILNSGWAEFYRLSTTQLKKTSNSIQFFERKSGWSDPNFQYLRSENPKNSFFKVFMHKKSLFSMLVCTLISLFNEKEYKFYDFNTKYSLFIYSNIIDYPIIRRK